MNNTTDEIEIIELLRKNFTFLKKNKWVLIAVFVLGSALGYYQAKKRSNPANAYYRTQFIVNSSYISSNEVFMTGREFSYEVMGEDLKNKLPMLESITFADCIKDEAEGKDPEINLIFESSKKVDVVALGELIKNKIKANKQFETNYGIESQNLNNQMKLIEAQLQKPSEDKNSTEMLAYIKLLEKKQELEKKMVLLADPVECYAIPPLNKLYDAPKFSLLLVFLYGFILSVFSGLLIYFIKIWKQVIA